PATVYVMSEHLVAFCLLVAIISQALSETLLERFDEEHQRPRHRIADFNYGTDAISGPKSALEVGTFRGQPIITRQHVGFVDNQGVPMAVLG
ncbi:hypothetical protein V3C99_013138, partial [Haemonchus contortus]